MKQIKITAANPKASLQNSLILLQEQWKQNQDPELIRHKIWSLPYRLPIEYQNSILTYCQRPGIDSPPSLDTLCIVAKWFRKLKEEDDPLSIIAEMEQFMQKAPPLNCQQINIINFNLAYLLNRIQLPRLALKRLSQIENFHNCKQKLEAQLFISLGPDRKKQVVDPVVESLIKDHEEICSFEKMSKQIRTRKSLSKIEFYNVGLCLKKKHKITLAVKIFKRLEGELSGDSYLLGLTLINISECLEQMGSLEEAIATLKKIKIKKNVEIEQYEFEIENKIKVWSELLKGSSLIKQPLKRQKQAHLPFIKNKRLKLIEEKEAEFQKLIGKENDKHFSHAKNKKNKENFLRSAFKSKKIRIGPKKETSNQEKVQSQREVGFCQSDRTLDLYKLTTQRDSIKSSSSQGTLEDELELISTYQKIIHKSTNPQIKADSYFKIGQIYHKNRRFDQAISMYKRSIEHGNSYAYAPVGEISFEKGKYRIAAEHFEKYLELVNKADKEIEMKLFFCYSMTPQTYSKVLDGLRRRLENDPSDSQAHLLLVTVLMKQKSTEKAIQACEQFRKRYCLNFHNHHLLGILYKEQGKQEAAFCSFIRALRINPLLVQSLSEINEMLESEHFYEQILSIYRKMLFQKEGNFIALQVIRRLVEDKSVKKTLIKDSLSFSELIETGDFFMGEQMLGEASYAYKQAQRINPNNTLIKEKLGNLAFFKGNYDEAEQYYRQCSKRKQISPIQCKIAHIKMKRHQFQEALIILEGCLRREKNKGMILNLIGQCLLGLGKVFQAMDYFKQSIQVGYSRQTNELWIKACHRSLKTLRSLPQHDS